MKPIISIFSLKLLFASLLTMPFALSAQEQDFRCDLVLGDWTGVHEQADGRSYTFDSALDEDGSIIVDFNYFEADETDRHEGYWDCENGVLTTGMVTRYGGTILYQYQILAIDKESMTYRQLTGGSGYPTFYSVRVGARTMNPEIYDRL